MTTNQTRQPGAGRPALTDLQKQVLRILLAHRFYNVWTYQPTTLVTQQEMADELHARQADISTALKALTKAGYIRPLWKPVPGQAQPYLIEWTGHKDRPDFKERCRQMQKTVPGDKQIARLREANAGRAPLHKHREPPDLHTLKTKPDDLAGRLADDLATEEQAQAEEAAMLAEQPDLEGYEGEAGKPA